MEHESGTLVLTLDGETEPDVVTALDDFEKALAHSPHSLLVAKVQFLKMAIDSALKRVRPETSIGPLSTALVSRLHETCARVLTLLHAQPLPDYVEIYTSRGELRSSALQELVRPMMLAVAQLGREAGKHGEVSNILRELVPDAVKRRRVSEVVELAPLLLAVPRSPEVQDDLRQLATLLLDVTSEWDAEDVELWDSDDTLRELLSAAGKLENWTALSRAILDRRDAEKASFAERVWPLLRPFAEGKSEAVSSVRLRDLPGPVALQIAELMPPAFLSNCYAGIETIRAKLSVARKDPAKCRFDGVVECNGQPVHTWLDFSAMKLPAKLMPKDWRSFLRTYDEAGGVDAGVCSIWWGA